MTFHQYTFYLENQIMDYFQNKQGLKNDVNAQCRFKIPKMTVKPWSQIVEISVQQIFSPLNW